MASSIYNLKTWQNYRHKLIQPSGLTIENDGITYKITLHGGTIWYLHQQSDRTDSEGKPYWETLGILRCDTTPYCCGVLQLGAFNDWYKPIPEAVGQEFMRLIRSYARWQYNKAILQAWFFRYRRGDYHHPSLMKLFTSNGFKKYGREAWNPNSGNVISGFQSRVTYKEEARA